jgi:para-nitrobenzyl esterase
MTSLHRTWRDVAQKTALAFAALTALGAADMATAAPVRVDGGLITGAASHDGKIRSYKGVPFAAPPVGDLRWRPPAPVKPWSGVRPAEQFGAACMQPDLAPDSLLSYWPSAGYLPKVDEDCLFVNVWTPATSTKARLPVMVWIHGGGYFVGYGHQPIFDGEALARKGVIVVTLNYRLGPLGFFAHPELTRESEHKASGNYAIMDMIGALQWVKRNAAAFGGDASKVTIFGQSGGSRSVSVLMASPRAKGLFQRAIGASGGAFNAGRPLTSLAQAEQQGRKLGEALKAPSLADLRKASAIDILKASPGRGELNLDGWVLPEDIDTAFAKGAQSDLPLLVGSNSDEGSIYGRPGDPAAYVAGARTRFGARADAYLKLYPATTEAEVRLANNAVIRDSQLGWGNWKWAHAQKKTGKAPVYYYYFDRAPPLPDISFREWPGKANFGAYHTAELGYTFDNLNVHDLAWTAVDRKLATAMSSYWTNFAKTGNPNGPGLPAWPAFDPARDRVMHLGQTIAPGPVAHRAGLEFFDAAFSDGAANTDFGNIPPPR